MILPHQKRSLWLVFLLHRLSGLILALFLPVHFYVLGLALVAATPWNLFWQATAYTHRMHRSLGCIFC